MIYLDTSVALAQLLAEDRVPTDSLWRETLVASRLTEYETWTRIHALRLSKSHGEHVRALLGRVAFVEMVRPVLSRAVEAFPTPVRTLDALHLATMEFLRDHGQQVRLATFDARLAAAARAMKFELVAI